MKRTRIDVIATELGKVVGFVPGEMQMADVELLTPIRVTLSGFKKPRGANGIWECIGVTGKILHLRRQK